MAEILNPELFAEERMSESEFAETIGDLSVSNVVVPSGNRQEGYPDDQPQGEKQFIGFVD